jgi:opacity protein-like surface antigen
MSKLHLNRLASEWSPCLLLLLAVCLLAPLELPAQSGESEVGEVAAFGGGIAGLGAHPAVGGSTGLAFSRYAVGLIETSYSPLGSDALRKIPAGTLVDTSRLYDFNFSFHIRVPVRERWAPYAILGGGFLWNTFNQSVTGTPGNVASSTSTWNFGFHTGGGLRYYIRDNWGICFELRVIVSSQTYTRFSVGIFYVLPENWP